MASGSQENKIIDVFVFDTYEQAERYTKTYFDANDYILRQAGSRLEQALREKEKGDYSVGKGLELKCVVHLYAEADEYSFDAGVRYPGELVYTPPRLPKRVASLVKNVRQALADGEYGLGNYTCFGFKIIPLFYTVREERRLSTEYSEALKLISEMIKK
ncbi:MAG TPA: hypothetical protein HA362_01075, partial [Nanoarchaeota archaeon]|nr:hypothetical protein [Nanoarchaeota archaeon]